MTEREEVREAIEERCREYLTLQELANSILSLTYPDGSPMLVVRAKDQELLEDVDFSQITGNHTAYHQAQQDMLDAGWVKVVKE